MISDTILRIISIGIIPYAIIPHIILSTPDIIFNGHFLHPTVSPLSTSTVILKVLATVASEYPCKKSATANAAVTIPPVNAPPPSLTKAANPFPARFKDFLARYFDILLAIFSPASLNAASLNSLPPFSIASFASSFICLFPNAEVIALVAFLIIPSDSSFTVSPTASFTADSLTLSITSVPDFLAIFSADSSITSLPVNSSNCLV